jgi:hypothetical protein
MSPIINTDDMSENVNSSDLWFVAQMTAHYYYCKTSLEMWRIWNWQSWLFLHVTKLFSNHCSPNIDPLYRFFCIRSSLWREACCLVSTFYGLTSQTETCNWNPDTKQVGTVVMLWSFIHRMLGLDLGQDMGHLEWGFFCFNNHSTIWCQIDLSYWHRHEMTPCTQDKVQWLIIIREPDRFCPCLRRVYEM